MIRVLFVCLGNICRSPLAEGIFRDLVAREGLADQFEIDSAGTGDWHKGELAHPTTRAVAEGRGLTLTHRARQIQSADLSRYNHVLVMDEANERDVRKLVAAGAPAGHIHRLRAFDGLADALDVPDPFYGGLDGFERVHDLVEQACVGFLSHLRAHNEI